MNSTNNDVFTSDPPVCLLKNLTVRVLEPHEHALAGELLNREHYLGDVPQGRQLLQAVEYQGKWVALLDWGPASWKLADREEWIGWTHQQRVGRLGLVVHNRRFLVLGKTRMPNLASKSLALALKKTQVESLGGYLKKNLLDPRRANRTFPCWSLLVFIAMALFAGRDNLAAIHRYGRFLTQAQRGWLNFPRKKTALSGRPPATPPCATCSSRSIRTSSPSASTDGCKPTPERSPAPWPSTASGYATGP